jgi:electron transfer flavoprotein alpha subunit
VSTLYLVDHDRGEITEAALEGLTAARALDPEVAAVTVGGSGDGLAGMLAEYGAGVVHQIHHDELTDYAPAAWGDAVVQLVRSSGATAVLAVGSERGNEVMAHVAAELDLPIVANCIEIATGDTWEMTRLRWGGSLHERARLEAPIKLATFGLHTTEAVPADTAGAGTVSEFVPELGPEAAVTRIVDRVTTEEGVTLGTAPVVVAGGRGVGSEEGFAALDELAELLGGAVGCSRVVTNNGWRNHKFQIGQTGTVIAPEVYIGCGISGAIQHWVGMMASKNVIAINTDPDAPMVTKADYAVIGDLHEVVPAVIDEIKRRRV